jgi:hypothetical protein
MASPDELRNNAREPLRCMAQAKGWAIDERTLELSDSDAGYNERESTMRNAYRTQLARLSGEGVTSKKRKLLNDTADDELTRQVSSMQEEEEAIPDEGGSRAKQDPYHISPDCFARPAQEALLRIQGVVSDRDVTESQDPEEVINSGVFIDHVTLQKFTFEECEAAVDAAAEKWCPEPGATEEKHPLALACHRFNFSWDGISWPIEGYLSKTKIDAAFQEEMLPMMQIMYRGNQAGNYGSDAFRTKVLRVSESIFFGYRALLNVYLMSQTFDKQHVPNGDDPTAIYFKGLGVEEKTPFQNFLIFLFTKIYESMFVRYKNSFFYTRVFNDKGQFVYAYRLHSTIKDWVWGQTNMFMHSDMWAASVASAGNMDSAIKQLQNTVQPQLPRLVKDRYTLAFRNGIYLVKEDGFITWEVGKGHLTSKVIACNYIPQDFNVEHMREFSGDVDWEGNEEGTGPRTEGTPWDIPTPSFNKILTDQDFTYQVIIWFYALFGRVLYWTRDHDNWQVWPFMHGRANTGKSTFCKLMEEIYDPTDTEVMANKIERMFGIWPLVDKFVILAPEVGKGFSIERTDLQSMITGESVSVKAKGQKAFKTNWRVPGMMSGNEIPAWTDTQGAMPRRLVIFEFNNKIQVDSMMDGKLRVELPNIILKSNRFYRAACRKVGTQELWRHLPEYFKKNRDHLQGELSSIHAFLASDELTVVRSDDGTIDETVYLPLTTIRDKYREWKQANDIKESQKWESDLYNKALIDTGLSRPKRSRLAYPRDTQHIAQKMYVMGLDLTSECERQGNIR